MSDAQLDNILIFGFGKMGSAIAQAIVKSDLNKNVFFIDINESTINSKNELVKKWQGEKINLCILAVKPQNFDSSINIPKAKVYLSIMAGLSIDVLKNVLGDQKIVRAMPNIAALQLQSTTAYCTHNLNEAENESIQEVLKSFGTIVQVEENQMDAFTAIAGSGPAYFSKVGSYIEEKAEDLGFTKIEAQQMVSQTIIGVASLLQSGFSLEDITTNVASKGGTTEAALKEFEVSNLKKIIFDAVNDAFIRAAKLNIKG